MLPAFSGAYWTEHSERNALPTAAAALGMKEEIIRRIVRWQVGTMTDTYVRSTITIVMDAQNRVARRVRAGGADFLGEFRELHKFEAHLRAKGHSPSIAQWARERLEYFVEGPVQPEPTEPTEEYHSEGDSPRSLSPEPIRVDPEAGIGEESGA